VCPSTAHNAPGCRHADRHCVHVASPTKGLYTSATSLGADSPFVGGVNKSWSFINIVVMLDLEQGLSGEANVFAQALLDAYPAMVRSHFPTHAVDVRITGLLIFGIDIIAGTEHDLLMMDGIAFPLSMVVLASILRSGRLLIIPALSMFISIVTAYLILWPIALHTTVISFAPSVMMSAVIAMSIDYSLFLLSRYREELKGGRDVAQAVLYMTWAAGHTVLVSGSTLVICFASLMFFPAAVLSSSGLGCTSFYFRFLPSRSPRLLWPWVCSILLSFSFQPQSSAPLALCVRHPTSVFFPTSVAESGRRHVERRAAQRIGAP
jgi:hypothetical protein